jgi:DNA-binding CsgD family transcriptional regulator
MDKQEAKTKLGSLSKREREVLALFCQGKPYKEIAILLFIEERTVRVHMGNVYTKLELRNFAAPAKRRELLHELFCPLLKEDLPPPPNEPKDLVPLSPDLEGIINEDDHALVRVDPVIIDIPPRPPRRRPTCLGIALLLLIGAFVGIGGTALVLNWLGFFGETSAQVSPTSTSEEVVAQASSEQPTETPGPQATQTFTSAPTSTPQPTATPFPLPFSDDFNNGASSDWEVVVGNWRMVDGAYTADDINDWNVILVGSEAWRDIVINVDAITNDWNYPMRVIVRAYQGKYLVMETDCCGIRFILNVDGEERIIAESDARGLTGSIDWHTNHIRIEASSGIYTLFIDGVKLLTVQDNTFESGRVGLSLDYENSRFDNFSVQQLSN